MAHRERYYRERDRGRAEPDQRDERGYRGGRGDRTFNRNRRQQRIQELPPPTRLRVDREKTCPFLLRVFCNRDKHHDENEFGVDKAPKDELQIYTWRDATLRELTDLIKQVNLDVRNPKARLSFAFVFPDRNGRYVMKQVGNTYASQSGRDDMKTLDELHFEIAKFAPTELQKMASVLGTAATIDTTEKKEESDEDDEAERPHFLIALQWKRELCTDLQRFHESYFYEFNDAPNKPATLKINQAKTALGTTVWDSAIVLAKYLEKNPHLVKGKQVIELGAGTGLTGLVAAKLGASHAVLTDQEQCLSIIKRNIKDNELEATTSAQILDWGQPLRAELARQLPFQLVLGADIMYIEEAIAPLLRTLHDLCGESTTVLFAYGRNRGAEESFLQACAIPSSDGYIFTVRRLHWKELDYVYQSEEIDVIELKKRPLRDCESKSQSATMAVISKQPKAKAKRKRARGEEEEEEGSDECSAESKRRRVRRKTRE